jgi:plasmid stability protein
MPSTQLTVRNVDPELSRRLRVISQESGDSLNGTVLRLLREAVGVNARRERLRRYAGWTADDLEEFDAALRAQRVVDARFWE